MPRLWQWFCPASFVKVWSSEKENDCVFHPLKVAAETGIYSTNPSPFEQPFEFVHFFCFRCRIITPECVSEKKAASKMTPPP